MPEGTVRIQLRCRAVSATVLIVMLVVRSGFVVCSALGPKFVSRMQAPNPPQDPQNDTQNAAGISKKGPQTTNVGPETGTRGPKRAKMTQPGPGDGFWCGKGGLFHERHHRFWSQNRPKIDKKKRTKKQLKASRNT